jgi:hypothetical protein
MQAALAHLGAPHEPVFDAPAPVPETTPTPPAPAPPSPGAPVARTMTLNVTSPQKLAVVRRRGALTTVGCNARCTTSVRLVVDSATRRAYKLPSRIIGRRTITIRADGRRTFRVVLTPKAERRLRRASRMRLSVQATWSGVKPAIRTSRSVRLRR